MNPEPPVARRTDLVRDELDGPRPDPYGWITEPDEPETADLLAAERAYYDARVEGLATLRRDLATEMRARVPALEPSAPWQRDGWEYREVTREGDQYPRLVRRPLAGGEEEVLLDLQRLHDEGGTGYARLGLAEVSPDGRLLAWSIDLDGDEVYALRFRDLATGQDLPDLLSRSYYGGAWSADSRSFLYTVHDEAYRPFEVRRHVLGTDPALNPVLVTEPDDRFELELQASRSGAWAVITDIARDTVQQWLVSLADPTAAPRLVRPWEWGVEYTLEHAPGHGPGGSDGFYVVTNVGATEGRRSRPGASVEFRIAWAAADSPGEWAPLVDERADERVLGVDAFEHGHVVTLRRDGAACLRLVDRAGVARDLVPVEAGGMVSLGRNEEWAAGFVTVVEESFITPAVWRDVPFDGSAPSERHRTEVVGLDPAAYVSERHLVPRPDGALVPVVTVRHRSTKLDGTAPLLLYGYGSYEFSCDPDWGIDWWRSLPSLLDRGVVFAMGHPRGGGEMGRRWWLEGHLTTKANTFDDQAAVADFLADGLVDGTRVVTRGLSAGGLLQGALYGRRPERWAGVLAEVPFVDVLTTMHDPSLPLTAQEWREWGDPRSPEEYRAMRSWSPIDNRPAPGARPPLLVTGAVNDPRVLVREPAKWVASLRHDDPGRGAGDDPSSPVSAGTVLFRCETGAGAHGGPSGRYAELDYEAEVLAWCLATMGVTG